MPTKKAVIDVGSHSVLLLVASESNQGLEIIEERYQITRLGQNLSADRQISPSGLTATLKTLDEYIEICERHAVDHTLVVGTAALREAKNQVQIVAEITARTSQPVRVLRGPNEARLTRLGAVSGLPNGPDCIVVDLGGRSTEITWPGFETSLRLGSQRDSHAFLISDPPGPDEILRLAENADNLLAELPKPPGPGELVGSGGTATSLASLELALVIYRADLVHAHVITAAALDQLIERLVKAPEQTRRTFVGLEPERARIIPAGAIILRCIMHWTRRAQIRIAARGLTWGCLLDWEVLLSG
jgi:exopolyphosphatase/guanosine-5'-triphosphate,3'-diphosphate pyrophosphatase